MGMQANDVLANIEQRNFQSFLSKTGRRSERTKAIYKKGVELLTNFLQKPHPDDTIEVMTKVDPYDLLDAFTGWLTEQGYSPNTTIVCISAAKKWLRYNDIKVYTEEMKEKVELPQPEEAFDEAPTKAQIRQLLSVMELKTQNKMLILSCSGLRPVDIWNLRWSDFKWDERPVRLIVPPYGKTKRGWETFITDELAERLKITKRTTEKVVNSGKNSLRQAFRVATRKYSELNTTSRESGRNHKRYKLHLYSLKKFFFSQATAEVGDAVAQAWCGRKAYLSTYLRLPLEDRQKLYLKVMPRLTIFTSETPKPQDRLRERLKAKGLSDEVIDNVLEGLVL